MYYGLLHMHGIIYLICDHAVDRIIIIERIIVLSCPCFHVHNLRRSLNSTIGSLVFVLTNSVQWCPPLLIGKRSISCWAKLTFIDVCVEM